MTSHTIPESKLSFSHATECFALKHDCADLSVSIHDILLSILDESVLRSVQAAPKHFNQRTLAKGRFIIFLPAFFFFYFVGGLTGQRAN